MKFRSALLLFAVTAAPALANSLIPAQPVAGIARSSFAARPEGEWNRLSMRPGKRVETWTLDGPLLNSVRFFGGVLPGEPLLREADKKRAPLPKVQADMLITDVPALLENTYRAQQSVSRMEIEAQEPVRIGGAAAVRFAYRFVRHETDVERRGEAVGAIKGGKLYLVTFEAPALHFFEKDLPKFRQLVATLTF